MEYAYLKKNINSKNKDPKKNNIICPNIKGNINPLSKDFLNFLKRKEFSNNFIYARAFNKVKTRNMKLYKYPKKISLKKSISSSKVNNMNNTLFIPKQTNRNNNKNKSEESYVSPAYISDDAKERNFQTNKIIISKENNIIIENKKESNKSLESIKNLWESLCVPMTYCELFHVILSQLDEIDKNKLIENEFNDLNELKNDIDTLLCIIKMRKEILNELKDMNNKLKLIFKKESEESNDLLVKNMSNKIEKLRNYTISICFCMKKIKNKIYDGNRIGKYDMEKIAKKFKFDKNYLIKMKEEMNFLKDGYAKYFFNIVEDQTPFLVKASEEDPNANGDPFIHLVPISKEVREKIEKCNYIIYQELISYQNKDFKENKFRPISPMLNYCNNNENINMKLNLSKYNRFNNNILLQRIKSSYKRGNYENDINFNLPKIIKDSNYSNSVLKENSCINLEIKKANFESDILIEKEKDKEKEKKINNNNNNFTICNNISTIIGRNNIDINLDFYKKIPKISNSIKNKKIYSSPSIYNQKNLKVIIYNKSINKFNEKYYKSYYKKIPQQEIDMFQIKNNLMQSSINGISPYILLIKEISEENNDKNIEDKIERNTIYGICSLFYIYNKNKISIKISHISTIINFNYSSYLNDLRKLYKILIDFIVEEFYFDELFIEYNKEKANQELLDIFVNYLNFNVEMTNRESDFNINININMSNFGTSKENGGETLNYNEIEKNVLILRKNNKNNEKINKVFSSLTGKNLFNIFSALIMIDTNSLISKDDEILKQKQNDIFSNLYINIEAVNYLLKLDNKTNINSTYSKITSLDQLMKIFLQNNMSTEEIPLSAAENRYNMLSCILNNNINTDFSNSNFFNNYNIYNSTSYVDKKTGIYYNFIKPEKIYIMFSENFDTIFYHIIHNNMALFFVQFNEKQKKNYFGDNNNIYSQIADIYKELLYKQIIGELNNKIIWIPCFNIYRHFKYLTNNNNFTVHEYIKVSNNIIFSKTKEQLKSFDIIFKNRISSFQVEPEINKDIIIDSDFIFGLINNANIFKNLSEQMSSFKDSKNYYDNSTEKINCEKYKSKLKDYSSISNIEIKQLNKEINKDELPYVIFLNCVKESDFKKNKSK